MIQSLSRFFDIRADEAYRFGITFALLFLLIAANNLIKIIRDSNFLSHHSVSELPYLYILVALLAGAIIATYTRYIVNVSITRLIVVTNAIIILNLAFFWFVIAFFDPAWSHYALYIWSAMAGAIAVAQLWTLANQIFTPGEGKRLYGLMTVGGTLGGASAGFGAKWAVDLSFEPNNLLWLVAALFFTASAVVLCAERHLKEKHAEEKPESVGKTESESTGNIGAVLYGSRYLQTIAVLILVSVVVSTLIDFQFKAAAKQTYPSRVALTSFFGSYYAWVSIVTFFAQAALTRKALNTFGLFPTLYLTPGVLLAGSLGIMVWPSVLAAAMTRMADAALRNSVHRSGMEILYMAVPASVKKTVKTFLDVVLERIGDATAGFILLLYSFFSMDPYVTYVHFFCVALIFVWVLLIRLLRIGHVHNQHKEIISHQPAPRHGGSASGTHRSDLWGVK